MRWCANGAGGAGWCSLRRGNYGFDGRCDGDRWGFTDGELGICDDSSEEIRTWEKDMILQAVGNPTTAGSAKRRFGDIHSAS